MIRKSHVVQAGSWVSQGSHRYSVVSKTEITWRLKKVAGAAVVAKRPLPVQVALTEILRWALLVSWAFLPC